MSYEQSKRETAGETVPAHSDSALERLHAEALSGDSYELTGAALEAVEDVRDFRRTLRGLPFVSFYDIFETITTIRQAPFSAAEKKERIEAACSALEERASRYSPRIADLYVAVISELRGVSYTPKFPMTGEKIAELRQAGDKGQRADIDVLCAGDMPWDMKLNRIETRLVDYLSGARALDKREGSEMDDDIRAWRKEELKKAPARPQGRRKESKPGVDPMERLKEGERAPAIWSIHPAYGGYYKEQSFSKWDAERNCWHEEEYAYHDAPTVPLCNNIDPRKGPIDITMRAKVLGGQWVSLPVPYTHDLHAIEAGGRSCFVQQDQNGDLVVSVAGSAGEEIEIAVVLAPNPNKRFTSRTQEGITAPDMPAEFSEETNEKIEEVKSEKAGNIARARALASYTRKRLKYLAPKDHAEAERYNAAYATDSRGFPGAVDAIREADCDVANTYFAALCARLAIPVRHVVGHSVKGKDAKGASAIHSGTGHAWTEVWDETERAWIRIDATPPGDPNLEEEQKPGGGAIPGDYGGGDTAAVRPTDEQLEALRKKLAERKEELSYTKEERQLAETAGVELKEARQIVREINEAERIRLPNGELVVDALSDIFRAILESRRRPAPSYTGPVRRREGGGPISDLIRHYIGVQAGDSDPMSRERIAVKQKEEYVPRGINLYVVGDKSGSMDSEVGGEVLWKLQRKVEYLLFSSLYRFSRDAEKAHLPPNQNIDARTMAISFRGNGPDDIDLDKHLASRFSAEDKVKMWHSLGVVGGGPGDVAALKYLYEIIKQEQEHPGKEGEGARVRVVIAFSDGGYLGQETDMRSWAEELSKLGVIVVGIGLTKTAASVPVVMHNPPHSFGEVVTDLDRVPGVVAKHIVMQAVKLFSAEARERAVEAIEETIHKFGITV